MRTMWFKRLAVVSLTALVFTRTGEAQVSTVSGSAVRADTGAPLSLVQVTLVSDQGEPGPVSTRTGAAGEFVFEDVKPGPYRLMAMRNGFLAQQYGQRSIGGPGSIVLVPAGQPVANIEFRLTPAATVAGRILGAVGAPLPRFQVQLMVSMLSMVLGLMVQSATPQSEGFVPLFDGKSLQGWTVQNTNPETFTVKNGVLHVEGREGWLKSDRQYTDFDLRVEFRFLTDNADSGVFVRAVGDSIFLRGWPGSSYQVQTRDVTRNQSTNPILIGNIYRHGNRGGETNFDSAAAIQASRKTGEWQTIEIEVRGDSLTATLNGTLLTRANGLVNPAGHIGIQGESGVMEYRSIQIRER